MPQSWRNLFSCGVLGLFFALSLSSQASAIELRVIRTPPLAPLMDPLAEFWDAIPVLSLNLASQMIARPRHPTPAVQNLQVKAAHNGQWMSFLLQWRDDTPNERILIDEFGDQAALELPIVFEPNNLPSPMMGEPGGRVSIMQWRAAFQRDIEQGRPQAQEFHPHALIDVYPEYILQETDVWRHLEALGLGNPISGAPVRQLGQNMRGSAWNQASLSYVQSHGSPILDQMAEGWGTMTVKPSQHANGWGIWRDKTWRVTIAHPLNSDDGLNDPQLYPGGKTAAAFAVWDGGNLEAGSRKAWVGWVPVRLSP